MLHAHTKHVLHTRTATLQVRAWSTCLVSISLQENLWRWQFTQWNHSKTFCLTSFMFGESWNFIFLGRFRFSAKFGHSPKYYPPIIAVSRFAKVFSPQNFVSYSIAWDISGSISFCISGLLYLSPLFFDIQSQILVWLTLLSFKSRVKLLSSSLCPLKARPCLPRNRTFCIIVNNIWLFIFFWLLCTSESISSILCCGFVMACTASMWNFDVSCVLKLAQASFQLMNP